jgi:hypothetical protein
MVDRWAAGQPKGSRQNGDRRSLRRRLLRGSGWTGVLMAVPFFVWVPVAWVGLVPSMVDVFGMVGLRTPASITIGGLLLAAIGFHDF